MKINTGEIGCNSVVFFEKTNGVKDYMFTSDFDKLNLEEITRIVIRNITEKERSILQGGRTWEIDYIIKQQLGLDDGFNVVGC